MKMKLQLLAALALMGTMPFALTACGGSECGEGTTEQDGKCIAEDTGDSVTCAEGTTLTDGKCEADANTTCGEGTELDGGECVATGGGDPSEACGSGTSYDESSESCVPNSTIECGEGTTEEDGKCVADEQPSNCAAGTTEADDGSCVVDPAVCGENTVLEPNSNTCLVSDAGVFCGGNTAYDMDSDSCLPTDQVCDTGTTFSTDTGLCLPDATCKQGDVILDGICVAPLEEAIANADQTSPEVMDPAANNDDPLLGGTPGTFSLAAMGAPYTIAGHIQTPVDLDGDMVEDQDLDFYTFSATAGQTINVSVQPTAGPSLSFAVVSGTGAPTSLTPTEGFLRYSAFGLNSGSARSVVIPEDGDYTIIVAPSFFFANGFEGGPSGADNWTYALRIEEVMPFTATDIDPAAGPITGDFRNLSDNYFKLTNFTGGPGVLTVNTIGSDIGGAILQATDANGNILLSANISQGDTDQLVFPAGDVYFLFDWTAAFGRDTAFDVTFTPTPNDGDLGLVAPGTPATSAPLDYMTDQQRNFTVSASAGDFLELTHINTEEADVSIRVTNSLGDEVYSDGSFNVAGDASPGVAYFYAPRNDTFLIEVLNDDANNPVTTSVITVNAITPADQGMAALGGNINVVQANAVNTNYADFNAFVTTEDLLISGSLTNGGAGDPDLFIFDASTGNVVNQFAETGDETISGFNILPAGSYIAATLADGALTGGYTLDLNFAAPPVLEVEPNDDTATATPLGAFPFSIVGTGGWGGGGQPPEFSSANVPFDYFSFDLAADFLPGEELRLSLESIADTDPSSGPQFELLDSTGAVVADSNQGPSLLETLEIQNLTAGTYYVAVSVSFTTSFNTLYNLQGEIIPPPFGETEPNNAPATATALPAIDEPAIGSSTRDGMDPDIFSFDVTTPGSYNVALETTGANSCAVLSIHNATGDIIEQDSGSADLDAAAYLQAGTYLFSISGNCAAEPDAFTYDVVIEDIGVASDVADTEPNNDSASATMATAVMLPGTTAGTIDSVTDEDWYRFSAPAGGPLTITVEDFAGVTPHQGMTFEFFDVNGASLGVDAATVPAGDFFVKVAGFNDTDFTGNSYVFSVNPPPADYFTSPALAIPDNDAAGITSILNIPDGCIINDVVLYTNITHTYRGDLIINLTSPTGAMASITGSSFTGTPDYIGYWPGDFTPVDTLATEFGGLEAMGDWTLYVEDTFGGDQGTINAWGLDFTCAP